MNHLFSGWIKQDVVDANEGVKINLVVVLRVKLIEVLLEGVHVLRELNDNQWIVTEERRINSNDVADNQPANTSQMAVAMC